MIGSLFQILIIICKILEKMFYTFNFNQYSVIHGHSHSFPCFVCQQFGKLKETIHYTDVTLTLDAVKYWDPFWCPALEQLTKGIILWISKPGCLEWINSSSSCITSSSRSSRCFLELRRFRIFCKMYALEMLVSIKFIAKTLSHFIVLCLWW